MLGYVEHNNSREVGLREARTGLADLVTDAAVRGVITYLTNRGRRVAAIVPVPAAEAAEYAERETQQCVREEAPL